MHAIFTLEKSCYYFGKLLSEYICYLFIQFHLQHRKSLKIDCNHSNFKAKKLVVYLFKILETIFGIKENNFQITLLPLY